MLPYLCLLAGYAISGVLSTPAETFRKRDAWTDPPFSVSTATMASAVTCPNGIQNKAGGIVFLVHGTGSSGADSWTGTPYNLILPNTAPGYDICWVDLPGHSIGNAATSAEYVAYNIQQLAQKSATGKVFVIGHSQGAGCNIPWALDFFPSTQQLVAGFIAISGDFHGVQQNSSLLTGIEGLIPSGSQGKSAWQQAAGSQYLRAQNIDGGKALVNTTSLFTAYDTVIPPEPEDSTLEGASNILIQSSDACGPLHVTDHALGIFDSGYFGLALDAFTHGGEASTSRLDKAYCLGFKGNTLVNPVAAAAALYADVSDIFNLLTESSPYVSTSEPPLPEYVCQRYPSEGFRCAPGPLV